MIESYNETLSDAAEAFLAVATGERLPSEDERLALLRRVALAKRREDDALTATAASLDMQGLWWDVGAALNEAPDAGDPGFHLALRGLSDDGLRALAALAEAEAAAAAAPPQPMTAVEAAKLPRPPRLLAASGEEGAVLSIGEICLLAGAGNVGKSALAGEIAMAVADHGSPDDTRQRRAGGLLDIHGGPGPVLWLAYEETPGEIGARLAALADATGREEAPGAVHILDMRRGWPLYGPGERHGAAGLYSARPEPLAGWRVMADAAAGIGPRLIVIDPTLSAYVGEGNAVAPVREFLVALAGLAGDHNAGVLALAHSTKAARKDPDPFDPGQIAGSAAWHDGVRGALVLDYHNDPEAGPQRRLAVTKANMGPARILRAAIPRRKAGSGWIIGFHADDAGRGWHDPTRPAAGPDRQDDNPFRKGRA